MDQAFPLPDKIPVPRDSDKVLMEEWGFVFHNPSEKYTTYDMPSGWKFVNVKQRRPDMIYYVFVDCGNCKRATVIGSWKNFYDCRLITKIMN